MWPLGELPAPSRLAADLLDVHASRERQVDLGKFVREPRSLAVAANGEILVADTGGHRVVRLDSNGRFLDTFGRPGRGAGEFEQLEDIALDRAGRIYTLDSRLARVQVFMHDGTWLRTIGENSELCTPAGFALGPNGEIYVADTCRDQIVRFEGGGKRIQVIRPKPPQKLDQPVDVAVGSDGLLYIADLTPRIIALNPVNGEIRHTWPVSVGTLSGGSNVALCGTRLFVSDPNLNVVHAIDVSSTALGSLKGDASAPFAAPLGVACSSENQLFVIDQNGKQLQVFADPLDPASQ
jgi:streptogramin lyase